MSSRRPPSQLSGGFTLVELVVCIVLAAIVAGFMVLFLDFPVQEYFQQTRRADLVDSADRVANAMTTDLRTALPNSLRTASVGAVQSLEFLQTEGTTRYYGAGDKNGAPNEELTTGTAVSSFGTLDTFDPTRTVTYSVPYLSTGNLGTPGHDAYSNATPVGTMTPAGVSISINPQPSAPFIAGENQVTLGAPMTFVPDGLPTPGHNAYLVSGPVSYVCDPVGGTLMRYTSYAVTALQAVPPAGAASSLIAHDVSNCNLYFFKDAAYGFGEIAILSVTLASGGESFQVFVEAPTEYVR